MPPNTVVSNKFSRLFLDSDSDSDSDSFLDTNNENKNQKMLSELPDSVQLLIFSYLPYRTRLALLTEKYPQKYCFEKLNRLPVNMITYTILHKYAAMVTYILKRVLVWKWDKPYSSIYNCYDWMNNVSELERRGNFSEQVLMYKNTPVKRLILAAFTHYRKIYSRKSTEQKRNNDDINEGEAIMMRLYAFVVGLNV
jgi:hypothetical protein